MENNQNIEAFNQQIIQMAQGITGVGDFFASENPGLERLRRMAQNVDLRNVPVIRPTIPKAKIDEFLRRRLQNAQSIRPMRQGWGQGENYQTQGREQQGVQTNMLPQGRGQIGSRTYQEKEVNGTNIPRMGSRPSTPRL